MENNNNQNSNQNGQTQEKILRNTGYLTVAFILQKIISFLYFIYIARLLGPVDLGLYDPVKSLIPILLILIDFSLSVVLVREIARAPERAEEYLCSVLGMKAIFAFVILLSMGLFTNFSHFDALIKTILYLDGVIVILDTFTLTFFAVFRGFQNMKYESIGIIITQIVTVIIGVTGLIMGVDLRILFIAVLAGSLFNFVFSYIMLRRKLKIRIRFAWNKQIIKTFLKIALPFAIYAMLVKAYSNADRYLLLALTEQKFVGWYIISHKLTYALEFLPSAFAVSIFPAMSAFYLSSKIHLTKTFEKAMYYLMILAIPISMGMITLADKIIDSLYGPVFSASIEPLRILMIGLIVIFLNFPVGAFLNACNKQVVNTINMSITVVVNIILNIVLIKYYSFSGAAAAALISGFLLFFLGLRWVGKIIDYNKKLLIKTLGKCILAAGIMSAALYYIKANLDITINLNSSAIAQNIGALLTLGVYIIIGALIYFVVMYLIKGFTKNDINFFYQKVIKKILKKGA